jgi:hypothetical protein
LNISSTYPAHVCRTLWAPLLHKPNRPSSRFDTHQPAVMYNFLQRSPSQKSISSSTSSTLSQSSIAQEPRSTHRRRKSNQRVDMAIKLSLSASSYAKCSPPSLSRQHSYFTTRQDSGRDDATATLARVVLRTGRSAGLSINEPSLPSSPTDSVQSERRTSWEDFRMPSDGGYISFPDFDTLVHSAKPPSTQAQHGTKASG